MRTDGRDPRRIRGRGILLATAILALGAALIAAAEAPEPTLFADDFSRGLDGWSIIGPRGVRLHDSGDPAHGSVLLLRPYGDVAAVIEGSERWSGVALEGEVLFPSDENNYLGLIYNFQRTGERTDFGLLYIKGNGSYVRVNPHRDFNVGRTLYEEYRTPLEGPARIETGEWMPFRLEVIGDAVQLYVGDVDTPQVTFAGLELHSGAVGLQPRSVGGDVWVDNVVVRDISEFSYQGPPRPSIEYDPGSLLTDWLVAGPFDRTHDALAEAPEGDPTAWRPFATDNRGAVITQRVVDYHGPDTVAYFRVRVRSEVDGQAVLDLSTVDDLALWVNGRFHWFVPRSGLAWWDFTTNPDHAGRRIPIDLHAGLNELVLRVRGGVYASGGFYAALETGDTAE